MSKFNIKDLQISRQDLTKRYKTTHQTDLLNNTERKVYIESRMPATQAVCEKVLSHIDMKDLCNITSLLDLGCGPGSATNAALKKFQNLQTIHLIDQDNNYDYNFGKPYKFFEQNFNNLCISQSYDVIIISYALNECDHTLIEQVLLQAWEHTNKYLIVIEPGTPYGYAAFLASRKYLIDHDAIILAPCPHELSCPLIKPDWCHFKIRLQRTKMHKQIKQGTLAFEDESYIFGIFAKQSNKTYNSQSIIKKSRIIKKPIKKPGNILFELCTKDGLQQTTISRKNKNSYIAAKKLGWGDDITQA